MTERSGGFLCGSFINHLADLMTEPIVIHRHSHFLFLFEHDAQTVCERHLHKNVSKTETFSYAAIKVFSFHESSDGRL